MRHQVLNLACLPFHHTLAEDGGIEPPGLHPPWFSKPVADHSAESSLAPPTLCSRRRLGERETTGTRTPNCWVRTSGVTRYAHSPVGHPRVELESAAHKARLGTRRGQYPASDSNRPPPACKTGALPNELAGLADEGSLQPPSAVDTLGIGPSAGCLSGFPARPVAGVGGGQDSSRETENLCWLLDLTKLDCPHEHMEGVEPPAT